MSNAEIAAYFSVAGSNIPHLATVGLMTILDILEACIQDPEPLAVRYQVSLEDAMARFLPEEGA